LQTSFALRPESAATPILALDAAALMTGSSVVLDGGLNRLSAGACVPRRNIFKVDPDLDKIEHNRFLDRQITRAALVTLNARF